MHKLKMSLAAAAVCFVAVSANATTVTYQSIEADPKVQLTIDDAASPGKFRFSLSTVFGIADFLGLAFDFAGSSIDQSNISLVSFTSPHAKPRTPALVLYGDNTGSQRNCGKQCNMKGAAKPPLFDYIIRIGKNGGGKKFVSGVVFDIEFAGSLLSNPFSNFAVRAQNASGPDHSIKTALDTPSQVPLPAAGVLLFTGLLGLGVLGRRRRKIA